MFAQKVKGIMVDLDVFNGFCTSWYTKYGNMKPYFFERLAASWIMKQGLVPAEHSLFENSLRKIYGRDFFGNSYSHTAFADGQGLNWTTRMASNYGKYLAHSIVYEDSIKVIDFWNKKRDIKDVAIVSDLATKCMLLNKEVKQHIKMPIGYDMPDYMIIHDDWYAVYPNGHKEYVGPTGKKLQQKGMLFEGRDF